MPERKHPANTNRDLLPTVLSVRQAAQLLGVHINTVRNWGDRGVLPSYRIGPRRDRRFRLEDIVAFLQVLGTNHQQDG